MTVNPFPRVTATLSANGYTEVVFNGTSWNPTPQGTPLTEAREAAIAFIAERARQTVRRPVAVTVTDPQGIWNLTVTPDGQVPSAVAVVPNRRQERRRRREPPPSNGVETPPEREIPVPDPPLLAVRLTFSSQPAVTLIGPTALGRRPDPIEGRVPLPVASPGRLLSRTHALVDLVQGQITVTDHNSGNGILTDTAPPQRLHPNQPYPIASGTTLVLGDVRCTFELVSEQPKSGL